MNEQKDNRRNNPRAPIELKVEYPRLNTFFADYTRNISRGGTFIKTNNPLPIGTQFLFKLEIPSLDKPIILNGKVQWIISADQVSIDKPAGMGIEFLNEPKGTIDVKVEQLMIDSLGKHLYEKLFKQRLHSPFH